MQHRFCRMTDSSAETCVAESENPISSASSCIWCWSGCHCRPSLPPPRANAGARVSCAILYIYINMNHNTHPSPKTSSWCHLRMPPGSGAVDVSICLRFDIIWPTAHRAQCMESTFLLHNSFPHLLQSLGYCTSKPERLAWNSLQTWENPKPLPPTWICVTLMLAKSSKHILPNGGLMVVYHGRIRKKITPKNKSKYRNCATHYCWAVGSRNSDHQQSERYHPVQTNLSPEKCRSEDEMPSLTWFFVFLGGFLSKSFRGK